MNPSAPPHLALATMAQHAPDRIALRYLGRAAEPRIWRYGELDHEIRALAARMTERLQPGDRVLLLMPGEPLHLRLQYQMDLRDPDNYFHLMHRITVGFPSGNLCLHDTHGPVLWARRFHVPRVDIGAARLEAQLDAGAVAAIPMVRAIGPSHGTSLHAILTDLWPAAIARQLRQIEADQRAQRDPLHAGQRSLDLCLAWEALTDRLGPPAYSSLTSLDRADATAAEAVLLDESAEQTP
ncbi:hypothetical protein P3W85_40605 [Cupriavidus basilensis]|uniref:Thiazolinyl imine reductase-like C-terminal domain-containing protein n=1 Tax=Cupriavidus basilensis TaxID=68895 RepID=A0ABT6B2S9_9BURK|nr:hypothetical protein [Cupriavidus basilensis]MDF3839196.1 hypothetical protein [Cupriavidus basilensis]